MLFLEEHLWFSKIVARRVGHVKIEEDVGKIDFTEIHVEVSLTVIPFDVGFQMTEHLQGLVVFLVVVEIVAVVVQEVRLHVRLHLVEVSVGRLVVLAGHLEVV